MALGQGALHLGKPDVRRLIADNEHFSATGRSKPYRRREVLIEADNPVVMFTGNVEFVPTYATPSAAGADLRANLTSPISLKTGDRRLVPTGISVAIPAGWEGQIRPRSGLSINKGVTLLNSPGTIDSDYRGELKVILINLGKEAVVIEPGERIAQLVISRSAAVDFKQVEELPPSNRGAAGFGSTGK